MPEKNRNNYEVLLVEDDSSLGELLLDELDDMGLTATLVNTAEQALFVVNNGKPELIISDLRLPGADGLTLLRDIRSEYGDSGPVFLIITAFGSVSRAVECLKAGAEDFLTKPLDLDHFKITVRRILENIRIRRELQQIKGLIGDRESVFHGIYGRSAVMRNLFSQIRRLAKADGPVLIQGESGTGKEMVARAIHCESHESDKPFLVVNCAGIPEHLLESEFFGHEAGAFTGAGAARRGIFAEAAGGTLLLDEISEMPMSLQARILRMLQDGKIRPVGSNREQQINVRILAATNRDIEDLVADKRFREDLFFRLYTFPLNVPPLRDRDDDIDMLAGLFLHKYSVSVGKNIRGFTDKARRILHNYSFPGNVRELQNAVERAVVYCYESEIGPEHLPPRLHNRARLSRGGDADSVMKYIVMSGESLPDLDEVECRYIRMVVERTGGNKRMAASILGITRRTLYRKLQEYDISQNRA